MEKYNRHRLKNIQAIFEEKTGVNITEKGSKTFYGVRTSVALVGMMFCFLVLSGFAYSKFSGIAGDEVGFNSVYKGEGIFEITIANSSDKDLELQEQIKIMRWLSAEEVHGDTDKIVFENTIIKAHSEGTIRIDLSAGYNISELEKPLSSGDWYYFVFTNNNFIFGQDWMCSIDFDQNVSEEAFYRTKTKAEPEKVVYSSDLRFEEWTWPTISKTVSSPYGEQKNGNISDHINIAGNLGDEVYSVADGIVVDTGFEVTYGNYILIKLEDGITVKYGHLKEILVDNGEQVDQGQEIGKLGKTGMATGAILSFAVYQDGEAINPIEEYPYAKLSDEEYGRVKKVIYDYYSSKNYEVVSINRLKDNSSIVREYDGYNQDEIVYFEIKEKNSEANRYIAVGSKDNWFNCDILNEGY